MCIFPVKQIYQICRFGFSAVPEFAVPQQVLVTKIELILECVITRILCTSDHKGFVCPPEKTFCVMSFSNNVKNKSTAKASEVKKQVKTADG